MRKKILEKIELFEEGFISPYELIKLIKKIIN
jgi:hypothetical protein